MCLDGQSLIFFFFLTHPPRPLEAFSGTAPNSDFKIGISPASQSQLLISPNWGAYFVTTDLQCCVGKVVNPDAYANENNLEAL